MALCREYASRNSIDILSVYSDRAQTSASMHGRDGLAALMFDAQSGRFDCVVVEAIDRISRDQEDLAGIYKRLTFNQVDIIAVHEGVANEVQIGIRGLLGSLFLSDLKHKVRRGMIGVVSDGRSAGGIAYGYDMVLGKPGERTINEEQAAVVRRIFGMYIGGMSPREIAFTLNKEGVPPPRGAKWNASTINGNKGRTYGILTNPLYGGKLVWNRVRMVRDPDTGRRVSRPNPESEWKVADVPHLAIVPEDVFAAAGARKEGRSRDRANGKSTMKPRRIFSGLLRCGVCGGGMSMHDRYKGAIRIKCSRYTESRSCENKRSYRLDKIEAAVVGGLCDILKNPEAATEYIRAYNAERHRAIAEATRAAATIENRLLKVTAELDRLIKLYSVGTLELDQVEGRMKELQAEKKALTAEAATARAQVPVVEIHPAAISRFYDVLEDIRAKLEAGEPIKDAGLLAAIRGAISHVVVRDIPSGGYEAEVVTYVSALTGEAIPNLGGKVVAEEGRRLNRYRFDFT